MPKESRRRQGGKHLKKIIAALGVATAIGLAACSGAVGTADPHSAPAPAATSAPVQPSPVASTATLTSTCTAGIYDSQTSVFTSLTQNAAPAGQDDEMRDAYQVTLVNPSPVTAEVNGLAVVFYTGSGTEVTSDQETFASPSFVTPGQSLTFTEAPEGWQAWYAGGTLAGPFAIEGTGTVDASITCSLVQWYSPEG
jgi:hypothetical protein